MQFPHSLHKVVSIFQSHCPQWSAQSQFFASVILSFLLPCTEFPQENKNYAELYTVHVFAFPAHGRCFCLCKGSTWSLQWPPVTQSPLPEDLPTLKGHPVAGWGKAAAGDLREALFNSDNLCFPSRKWCFPNYVLGPQTSPQRFIQGSLKRTEMVAKPPWKDYWLILPNSLHFARLKEPF